MSRKKESFFWTSYSDLMTSLFFIMLVLFVLVIVLLHKRMEATEAQLKAIKEVVSSTKDLKGNYFEYRKDYKKYILKIECQFPVNGADINMLNNQSQSELLEAGKGIQTFLEKHRGNQYLVIIEGQSSRNSINWMRYNYRLSFERALSLRAFWQYSGIDFGNNCELQIAGSGDGRLNDNSMREPTYNEQANQRFLVYIIPKNIIEDE